MTFLIGLGKGERTFFGFWFFFFKNKDDCSKTKLLEDAKKCKLFDVIAQKKWLFVEVRENALCLLQEVHPAFLQRKIRPWQRWDLNLFFHLMVHFLECETSRSLENNSEFILLAFRPVWCFSLLLTHRKVMPVKLMETVIFVRDYYWYYLPRDNFNI